MLRDLSADQLREAFSSALSNNGYDPNAPVFQQMLSQFDFDPSAGSKVSLFGLTDAQGVDILTVDSSRKGVNSFRGRFLAYAVWKMWFGNPIDGGIASLKAALLGLSN